MVLDISTPTPAEDQKDLKMGVPYVTSFCCCLGLESGAKAVGFMHLLVSLVITVVCSLFVIHVSRLVGTSEDADGLYTSWRQIGFGIATMSVVHSVLAVTLIVSLHKRNVTGIRVWIYVMLVLFGVGILLIVITCFKFGLSSTGSDIFLAFLEGLLIFGVLGYCILCVNSYYLMLKSTQDMEGYN